MNKNHVTGSFQEGKGKLKEEVGHAVGNDTMAGEGVVEQVTGKITQAIGDIKDRVKDAVDKVLEKKPDVGDGRRSV